MTKACSRCLKIFECFVLRNDAENDSDEKAGCWCEGVQLNAETLKILKQQFDNCLCPECLITYRVPSPQ